MKLTVFQTTQIHCSIPYFQLRLYWLLEQNAVPLSRRGLARGKGGSIDISAISQAFLELRFSLSRSRFPELMVLNAMSRFHVQT